MLQPDANKSIGVAGQLISTGVLRGLLGRTDEWAWRIPVGFFDTSPPINANFEKTVCHSMGLASSYHCGSLFGARVALVAGSKRARGRRKEGLARTHLKNRYQLQH